MKTEFNVVPIRVSNKALQRRPRSALHVITGEAVRGPAERGSLDVQDVRSLESGMNSKETNIRPLAKVR